MTSGDRDEARSRATEPAAVGDVIDTVLSRIGGGRRPPLLEIRERWNDIVGGSWQASSRPVKVTGDTVVVEVRDGATASVLRFELDHVERRLAELAPTSGVTKVRLRVASRPWSQGTP